MTNLLKTKKVLSALLLVAIIAVVSAFLIAASEDSPTVTADHPSVNSPAELDDLQFMADQEGITLEESIARYAWGDDFSESVGTIRDNDPSSIAGVAITGGSTAVIRFSGPVTDYAQRVIDDFEAENHHVTISTPTNLGYTEREAEEAVVGAYYSVMAENGVEDGTAYFEDETNEIVIYVKTATPPSDDEKDGLQQAAEQGAKEATRPNITDTFTISLSVIQRDLGGLDSGSDHMGGEELSTCTSGFNVKVNGVRGIVTAAHCPDNLSDDGDALTFKDKHHGLYGDVQWHTGPDTMSRNFYSGSISVLERNQRYVTGVGTAEKGKTLCRNGKISYRDCQAVRRVNVCAIFVCRLVSMENYFAANGDSGAPVYWGNKAYGVHRGKTWNFGWREIFSQAIYFDDAISGMSIATN